MSTPSGALALDDGHPWPGLVSFTEESSRYFFGRSAEEDELFRRVQRETTTLLFGQSGLGKTSLLQASLIPRLRERGFRPAPVRLDHGKDAPPLAAQVKTALADTLGVDNAALAADPGETLWEVLHRRDLRDPALPEPEGFPAIVIDQFEEVFTLGLVEAERRGESQAFLIELADLIENRRPASLKARLEDDPDLIDRYALGRQDYRIVIAMREDYLPQLESVRARAPTLGANRFRLTRMNGRQALEAVIEPGRGLLDESVARAIVAVVGSRRLDDPFGLATGAEGDRIAELEVEPSLLSLFCQQLNERRIEARSPQITEDLLAANREHILDDFYEAAFAGQPPTLRVLVEDRLLTQAGNRVDVPRELMEQELIARGVPAAALDQLVRRRLLHVEERMGVARIELIHDVLAAVVLRSRTLRRERDETARLEATVLAGQAREAELRRTYARRRNRLVTGGALATATLAAVIVGLSIGYAQERQLNIELAVQKQQLAGRTIQLTVLTRKLSIANTTLTITAGQLTQAKANLQQTVAQLQQTGARLQQTVASLNATNAGLTKTQDYLSLVLAGEAAGASGASSTIAEDDYRIAVAVMPRPEAHVALGNLYYARGDMTEAQAEYNEALKEGPTFAQAYTDLGNVYSAQQNYATAISDFDKAIELSGGDMRFPARAVALVDRGIAYSRSHQLQRAVDDYNAALALEPHFALALNNLASAYEALGRNDDALADLQEALKFAPTSGLVQLHIGRHYSASGDEPQALDSFIQAASQGNGDAAREVGQIYEQGRAVPRDDRQAMAWYTIAATRGLPDAEYRLGLLYASAEAADSDSSEASMWMQRAADQGNHDASAWLQAHDPRQAQLRGLLDCVTRAVAARVDRSTPEESVARQAIGDCSAERSRALPPTGAGGTAFSELVVHMVRERRAAANNH